MKPLILIKSAVKELNSVSPLPQVQIIPKGAWPNQPTARIYIPTHLKSTFEDAVNLLKATGRNLSTTDEKYLHLLLTHYCGWSATYPEHMDDPWVKFFQTRYPQLKGLVPILDSMTNVEELVDFPEEYTFKVPRFFLLATSDSFFVYDATEGEDALRTAGDNLEDVYNGLKDCRWADSSEDPWGFVEDQRSGSHPPTTSPTIIVKKMGTLAAGPHGKQIESILENRNRDFWRTGDDAFGCCYGTCLKVFFSGGKEKLTSCGDDFSARIYEAEFDIKGEWRRL